MIGDWFHDLDPRVLVGFAVYDRWLVDALAPVTVGEFVEVTGPGGKVMAQGRVSRVVISDSRFKVLLTIDQVTVLTALEAACRSRR